MSIEQDSTAAIFGLTGGIGSGKSTVSEGLASRGAIIFDADRIVKDLQRPGEVGFIAMVNILGKEIIDENGELDKKKIASIIFPDASLRQEVQEVIHPMVWDIMHEEAGKLEPEGIAIFDVPLLKKEDTSDMIGAIVVNTPTELAVERAANRTIEGRAYTREEIRERLKTQASNKERLEMANFVIVNDGSLVELEAQIDETWAWIRQSANVGYALPHPSIDTKKNSP